MFQRRIKSEIHKGKLAQGDSATRIQTGKLMISEKPIRKKSKLLQLFFILMRLLSMNLMND